jgi:hypothetical protein
MIQGGKVRSATTVPPHDHFQPLDYLGIRSRYGRTFGNSPDSAEALGIGYAPKGMMKGTWRFPYDCQPAVCTENSNPDVMMVKPAEDRV